MSESCPAWTPHPPGSWFPLEYLNKMKRWKWFQSYWWSRVQQTYFEGKLITWKEMSSFLFFLSPSYCCSAVLRWKISQWAASPVAPWQSTHWLTWTCDSIFRGSQQLNFETPELCLSVPSVFLEFISCRFLSTEHQNSELLVLLLWFNKTPGFELDQVWILRSITNLNMSPTCLEKGVPLRGTGQITRDWSWTSLSQYYSYNLTPLHTVCPTVKQTELCADIIFWSR